jgi:hypothetical protein
VKTRKNRLGMEISEEEMERLRQRRLDALKKLSLAFQLGAYIGEEIVRRHLPTLSVDMIQSNKVINVSPEEEEQNKLLEEAWWNKVAIRLKTSEGDDAESEEWKNLREHHKELEEKYLPKTVDCYFDPINCEDETELKRGIVHALWHSDMSHYKCSEPDDVEVRLTEDVYFTIITIKRD